MNISKARLMLFALIAVCILGCNQTAFCGVVLYSDFADQMQPGGWFYGASPGDYLGERITVGNQPVIISDVILMYTTNTPDPNQVFLTINQDNSGSIGAQVPGGSWSSSGINALNDTIAFNGTLELSANTTYWLLFNNNMVGTDLKVRASLTNNFDGLGISLPSSNRVFDNWDGQGPLYYDPGMPLVFEVDGSFKTVPEPSTLMLLSLGMIGLVRHARRRKL